MKILSYFNNISGSKEKVLLPPHDTVSTSAKELREHFSEMSSKPVSSTDLEIVTAFGHIINENKISFNFASPEDIGTSTSSTALGIEEFFTFFYRDIEYKISRISQYFGSHFIGKYYTITQENVCVFTNGDSVSYLVKELFDIIDKKVQFLRMVSIQSRDNEVQSKVRNNLGLGGF